MTANEVLVMLQVEQLVQCWKQSVIQTCLP